MSFYPIPTPVKSASHLLVHVQLLEALLQVRVLSPDLRLQRVQVRLDGLPRHVHVPLDVIMSVLVIAVRDVSAIVNFVVDAHAQRL